MKTNSIYKINSYADDFLYYCDYDLVKVAFIRKLPNGSYVIKSRKGKILGKYKTKELAEKRLKQIEFFKHINKKKASKEDQQIASYSAIMRELRRLYDDNVVKKFQKEYKDRFDAAYLAGENYFENEILEDALNCITASDDRIAFIKVASAIELGDPKTAGKYLADLIRFITKRISPDKRNQALTRLKRKIYYINERDIAAKKTPASASLGNSITLLKTILLEHSPQYIREVINNIVRHL